MYIQRRHWPCASRETTSGIWKPWRRCGVSSPVDRCSSISRQTFAAARDAAEAIEVEYDPLAAITEAKDAIGPGAPQRFDHIPSNIVFDWDNDMGDTKATDAAFLRAARVVTLELVNNRVVVNSMEPRNAIADFDPASGRSTLYTATQGPHFVRDPLAEAVLKIPKEMLRLITPNVGGAV